MKTFDDWQATPGDISHAVDTSWEDVDITAHVGADAGNVAGVYLFIQNTENNTNEVGVRKNGSSDTYIFDLFNYDACYMAVGVDSNDVFELYMEDASAFNVWMIGYWLNSEAEFLDEAQNVTPGSANTWTNTDMSSYFTGEVKAVCVFADSASGSTQYWGGQDVDGPDRYGDLYSLSGGGSVVPCTSEACELRTGDTTNVPIYAIGAITSQFGKFSETNHDFSAADTYEDIDLSASIPAGGVAALYQHHDGTDDDSGYGRCMSRPDGESWDNYTYYHGRRGPWLIGVVNASRALEQKVSDADRNSYFVGYFTESDTGVAPKSQLFRRRGIL